MALISSGLSYDRISAGTTAQRPALAAGDAGSLRFNTDTSFLEQWNGTAWGSVSPSSGGGVTVGPTAPSGPIEGDLWYNTNDSRLYSAVNNVGGTPVWVDASPDSQNVYWDRDTVNGILSPITSTDGLIVNGAATFNEDGTDVDFRVEGDTDTDLLFVDAGSDVVAVSADATEVAALVANNADVKLYVNGDATMTSQNAGPLAGFRNHLINGSFIVRQRMAVQDPTNYSDNDFVEDRWSITGTTSSGINGVEVTVQDSNSGPLNQRSVLRVRQGTATETIAKLTQSIELNTQGDQFPYQVGTNWTLSFWYSGSTDYTTQSCRAIFRTGNGVQTGQLLAAPNFTGVITQTDGSWNKYAFTFTIDGDMDTDAGRANFTCLDIILNNFDITSQSVFTEVQLEPGPVATPFEHRPIAAELALCQRYFYKYTSADCPGGTDRGLFMTTFMSGVATVSACAVKHPQTMRVIPTVSNLSVRDNASASAVNDTTAHYFVVASPDDNSNSNRYPAVKTFECDAEL